MLIPIITLAPSVARTANANGDPLDAMAIARWQPQQFTPQLLVQLNVTAVSGNSPSLTVVIEDSVDGGVTWNTVGTFTAATAVSRQVIAIGLRGDAYPAGFRWPFNASRIRARWTITGTATPTFTFAVQANLL